MRAISEISVSCAIGGFLSTVALVWSSTSAADSVHIPDFTGLWARNSLDFEPLASGPVPLTNLKRRADGTSDFTQIVGDYKNPILKPRAAEIVKQRGEISLAGKNFPDPSNQCQPYAPPYAFSIELGLQILQQKDRITMIFNQDDQVRYVRLNTGHPAHVRPSAMGDSVGRYEGDTLVVDTVGIETGPLAMVDHFGTPHSEALHLVERYRLISGEAAKEAQQRYEKHNGRVGGAAGLMPIDSNTKLDGLELRFTVEDPNVFTTPWSAVVTYRRSTGQWEEQICAENPFEYYSGKATAIPHADKSDF
jgi:hypothetical protein